MKKEFIPMDLALRLKALGFDEPCFAGFNSTPFDYDDLENLIYPTIKLEFNGEDVVYNDFQTETPNIWTIDSDVILSPTYSQAFRWFREEYGYWSYVKEATKGTCRFYIEKFDEKFFNSDIIDTYEEAELACLKKLIEIVENIK